MPGTDNIDVLRAALKHAEDELCSLGHTLVNQGWGTETIALTLGVIRIALYGTDGAGNGLKGFAPARERLSALWAQEAVTAH